MFKISFSVFFKLLYTKDTSLSKKFTGHSTNIEDKIRGKVEKLEDKNKTSENVLKELVVLIVHW